MSKAGVALAPTSDRCHSEQSRPAKSPVPDLLFEEVIERRLGEIAPLLADLRGLDATTPLHRITLFATYACNLSCQYCKTIVRSPEELLARPEKSRAYRLEDFSRMLDGHAQTEVRHVHFTGGEATLLADLPEMVREAKARGVAFVSITTNGATRKSALEALIGAGIDEVRVSLDADSALVAERLSVSGAAFERTLSSLRMLQQLRQRGAPFYFVINTVVSHQNQQRIAKIVEFCLSFEPDDMKLITEVDERGQLGHFPGAERERKRVLELLRQYPPQRLPLLRRKLETVFAVDAVGLDQCQVDAPLRCYIPLTERTLDTRYYYPCSVMLREGGSPLGRVEEAESVKRARTLDFVRREDCSKNPICRRYCLACTRGYNLDANRRARGL